MSNNYNKYTFRHFVRLALVVLISLAAFQMLSTSQFSSISQAQDNASPSEADPFDRDGRAGLSDTGPGEPTRADNPRQQGISFLSLLFRGGWFMLPLLGLSIMVVVVTIERFIALRRAKVMPDTLVSELGALGVQRGGFDPRDAYLITQQHPSAAARVVQSMLQKVGRPISEIENVVGEASQREADRLHSNVRWLTLAAAVAPLIGLLGTVWGMIQAFYDTTQLLPSQDKGEALAQGIYIALVTTLAGLLIAIPAAVFAHFFESRITTLFHRIDEFVFSLIPQVEKYEGQLRFSVSEKVGSETVVDGASPPRTRKESGEPGSIADQPTRQRRTPAPN